MKSRVLINNSDVGVLKIVSKNTLDIVDKLKENKLLNLSKLSKELHINDGDSIEYYAYIPKISLDSFEVMCSALNNYCSKESSFDFSLQTHLTNTNEFSVLQYSESKIHYLSALCND